MKPSSVAPDRYTLIAALAAERDRREQQLEQVERELRADLQAPHDGRLRRGSVIADYPKGISAPHWSRTSLRTDEPAPSLSGSNAAWYSRSGSICAATCIANG
jgi:hypothetical protein